MSEIFDVVVIGYGPGGEVTASTIAAAGFKVCVIERWPTAYPLPRLTSIDGEVARIIQATGANIDDALQESTVQEAAYFDDSEGDQLMVVEYPGLRCGFASRYNVFQPDIERTIHEKIQTFPNVELNLGWEATEIVDTGDGVRVTFQEKEGQKRERTVEARYLVGADGARSFVRDALGIDMRDYDLHERWLNFDAIKLRPLPERFEKLRIIMDPARPHMFMPIGTKRIRFECRVMEGETDEHMVEPGVAWGFLKEKHGLGQEDIEILRHVVYHYYTRIASEWRRGNTFLVGDAAHTMTPYMGQGACAAFRDGRNLGWKLVEVLSGRSSENLLDEYEIERKPHVTTIVFGSDQVSRIVNIVDPEEAAKRNAGMRATGVGQPPDLPDLTAGILWNGVGGEGQGMTGLITPQGALAKNGVTGRGDDIVGSGFQLWARRDPASFLSPKSLDYLASIGTATAVFRSHDSAHAVEDIDGVYLGFMDSHHADFVIVRPDFYAFGGGNEKDGDAVVADLAKRLHTTDASMA